MLSPLSKEEYSRIGAVMDKALAREKLMNREKR
jgi:hypothetical protein